MQDLTKLYQILSNLSLNLSKSSQVLSSLSKNLFILFLTCTKLFKIVEFIPYFVNFMYKILSNFFKSYKFYQVYANLFQICTNLLINSQYFEQCPSSKSCFQEVPFANTNWISNFMPKNFFSLFKSIQKISSWVILKVKTRNDDRAKMVLCVNLEN